MRVLDDGVYSVMITPFDAEGEVDHARFEEQLARSAEGGSVGVIVAGSTGEFYSLTDDERVELFALAARQLGGTVRLVGGCNSSHVATRSAAKLGERAAQVGVDALMLLPPIYVAPTREEVVRFYGDVHSASSLPIMAYNNPRRTGVVMDVPLVEELVERGGVVALKDSSNDLNFFGAVVAQLGSHLTALTGMDPMIPSTVAVGGHGVASMGYQVCPEVIVRLLDASRAGRRGEAVEYAAITRSLYSAMYSGTAAPYAVLKGVMNHLGLSSGGPRLPLLPADDGPDSEVAEVAEHLRAAMAALRPV